MVPVSRARSFSWAISTARIIVVIPSEVEESRSITLDFYTGSFDFAALRSDDECCGIGVGIWSLKNAIVARI
jgi:hypothetical protein